MPVSRKVRDIMVPIFDYAVVNEMNTLREAALSLRKQYCTIEAGRCSESGHRNVLVFNNAEDLVGVLNFQAILGVLIPEILGGLTEKLELLEVSIVFAQADVADLDESRLGFRARVMKNAEVKVKDIMLKIKETVAADASLLDALKLIYRSEIRMLPVLDGKKTTGVVRESDLFLAVTDIFREDIKP